MQEDIIIIHPSVACYLHGYSLCVGIWYSVTKNTITWSAYTHYWRLLHRCPAQLWLMEDDLRR